MRTLVLVVALALAGWAQPAASLHRQMQQIASSAEGRVGAIAVLLKSGESAELHADLRFPMQSVYKFPIAMAVLHLVDRGTLRLEQSVPIEEGELVPSGVHSPLRDAHPHGGVALSLREVIRLAVSESDGTASDILLRLAGGPEGITAYIHSLGVTGIAVATTEKEMVSAHEVQYRNWATPRAMAALLRAFEEGRGLSADSRSLLMQLMETSTPGPLRLKGLLPPETVVAHKTGTSSTTGGFTAATNDVGLISLPDGRRLAVAVFVSDSKASTETREAVIARIARAAWDRWSPGTGPRQ